MVQVELKRHFYIGKKLFYLNLLLLALYIYINFLVIIYTIYIYSTLLGKVRLNGDIALAVASSGIAALLLSGGRTAHSCFKIPINIHEDSTCFIKHNSDLASLLQVTKLIIWDEAPMTYRHAFEAVDRILKDLMKAIDPSLEEKPFGGKVIVFGGDFRQILPVVIKGGREDIVGSCLRRSTLWTHIKLVTLKINMRLFRTKINLMLLNKRNLLNGYLKLEKDVFLLLED